jgi:hypothetical protein
MHRKAAVVFGSIHLFAALLVLFGVFVALPARWMPVDAAALAIAALLAGSGAALLAKAPWAERFARVAAAALLVVGLALVAALALTVSYLAGVYGPVGRGGAVILALVAALVLPYLVVLPIVELVWLARPARAPLGDAAPADADACAIAPAAAEKIA